MFHEEFPECCGAVVLSGFRSKDPKSILNYIKSALYDDEEEYNEENNEFETVESLPIYGIVCGTLNESQIKSGYGKVLIKAGFSLTSSANNPNSGNNIYLYTKILVPIKKVKKPNGWLYNPSRYHNCPECQEDIPYRVKTWKK